jgi:putative lysine transport system permease protein
MNLEWVMRIVTQYWPMFLRGAGITLLIATIGTVAGFCIGLLVGVVRTIPAHGRGVGKVALWAVNAVLSAYIEVFRGTPMIVQAMVIYYGSAIALGLNLDRLTAALLIVSINTGAYMAEIVR